MDRSETSFADKLENAIKELDEALVELKSAENDIDEFIKSSKEAKTMLVNANKTLHNDVKRELEFFRSSKRGDK